jgi:acyl-CoA synthetase (AMP-forming)/AMP-acid ligase II
MGGYWGKPEATAATITPDGWLRSGDGGHMGADGYIYVTDRIKDMIISGGENIYPREIEEVLVQHPAVGEAAVVGVPHEKWGEEVKAVVVLKEGVEAREEEILEFCKTRLAGYKRPRSVDFVDDFPKTATGKILKRVLKQKYWEGQERMI